MPRGLVQLTVIQFAGDMASDAAVEWGPGVITAGTAAGAATVVRNISQEGGSTPLHAGINLAVAQITGANAIPGARQIINIATDGGLDKPCCLLKTPAQAARNAFLNGYEGKMGVILGDIKNPPMAEKSADVITCNPPYRKASSGRINPDARKAIARHEIMASVDDILHAARRILRKRGRLALIYPSVRLVDILLRMRRFNLEPKRI